MAEPSKFASALSQLNKGRGGTVPSRRDRAVLESYQAAAPEPMGRVRPPGKRSDPDYSPTTFFVRKDTKRKATQILLEEAHANTDLSDLVEELLAKWVAEQSHA